VLSAARRRQRYHTAFHASTKELATIAKQAKPEILVLYHQLFWRGRVMMISSKKFVQLDIMVR